MSDDLPTPKIPVTKLDAALRQLHTAIELLFNNGDFIAVHTLASAAAVILHDIAGHRKVFRPIDLIRKEWQGRFISAIREPQNFFKHADRDPDAVLAFAPARTHFVIFDAMMICESLQIPLSSEREMFSIWFALQYPDTLDWAVAPSWMSQLRAGLDDYLDPLDPLDLKLFRELLIRRRKERGGY
jgi:hypothetical protein